MTRPVNIQRLELHYKNRTRDYILQEAKRVLKGEIERKVICISGSPQDAKDVVWRLKLSASMKKAEVVEKGELTKTTEGKKIYIYKTSELSPGDDYWVGKNHPGFVLVIEDVREFKGECEKLRL